MYGAPRGPLPARLLALLILKNTDKDRICRLAALQLMGVVNSGHLSYIKGLVTAYLRDDP